MPDFTLPELGENVTSGEVLRVLVKPGDRLAKDQPVVELETDKATIEVPSSVAGRITEVKVKEGDTINVGEVILSVDEGAAAPSTEAKTPSGNAPAEAADEEASAKGAAKADARKTDSAVRKSTASKTKAAETDTAAEEPREPAEPATETGASTLQRPEREKVVDISRGARSAPDVPAAPEALPAAASPTVRRMARELGVDINDVPGSGAGGRISADDVKAHVRRVVSRAAKTGGAAVEPLPDFSRWGGVERKPMRGVRRKTAEHVSHAWSTVPHVTQHDAADISALEELRERYAKSVEAAGGKLTVTAVLVKIVASALKRFPQFNASVDMAAEEIIYKQYVHVGIAVDTDRGLLVPVIRDADVKNVIEIAVALVEASEKARSGKLGLEEMQGGSFSISNLGGIGGTAFTPIVNWPEVATLGVSRARTESVYSGNGQFVPRIMLPLSLSYDHRVIDGADGIRFLRWIIEALEQPFVLML